MQYGLRVHEIAERKKVSVSLVAKLAMQSDFPPVNARVGRATFYEPGAIDLFFDLRKDGCARNRRKRRKPK